jgi:pyridoxal phosphate enzyme (YggS family)
MVLAPMVQRTVRISIFALDPFHMPITTENYTSILDRLGAGVRLVAVSKTKPAADVAALYGMGQRDFGENYVQELVDKQRGLPEDIRWHFIGHLQTNKVKAIIPFVHLIQGVDSLRLLKEIDKQAGLKGRVVEVLLQVHIAKEETKFGMDEGEVAEVMGQVGGMTNVRVRGLMGMGSNTGEVAEVRREFGALKVLYDAYFSGGGILSMGMSGDYEIAISEGSTMVRIGSLLFGTRLR